MVLDRGADRAEVRASLLALPGIGPWTADYVAMRALGDPDVWLGTDLGIVHALRSLGRHSAPGDGVDAAELESIRPWRSYAVHASLEPAFRAAGPGPAQESEGIVNKITTIDTPLGALGLASNGEALTAISFSEEIEDLRGLQVAASEDPILAETEAQLQAYFAGRAQVVRSAAVDVRDGVPASGVGGAARDPVRRDGFL